jgi:hypothetical protein
MEDLALFLVSNLLSLSFFLFGDFQSLLEQFLFVRFEVVSLRLCWRDSHMILWWLFSWWFASLKLWEKSWIWRFLFELSSWGASLWFAIPQYLVDLRTSNSGHDFSMSRSTIPKVLLESIARVGRFMALFEGADPRAWVLPELPRPDQSDRCRATVGFSLGLLLICCLCPEENVVQVLCRFKHVFPSSWPFGFPRLDRSDRSEIAIWSVPSLRGDF